MDLAAERVIGCPMASVRVGSVEMTVIVNERTKRELSAWANATKAVDKLWLFGSRARNEHRDDSDFDFAIELAPKNGNTDWAFGDFVCEADEWKEALRRIVNSDVSLVPIREDLPLKFDPRVVLIWAR